MRSRPRAMPPCGGVPYSSDSRKKPNRSFASSSLMPRQREHPALERRVVDADAAAADLAAVEHEVVRLREHARRDASSSRSMSASTGDVNGWCIATQRCSSVFHSSSGKSVTHVKANSSALSQPRLFATDRRSWPSTMEVASAGPQARSSRSARAGAGRVEGRADRRLAGRLQRGALNRLAAAARPDQAARAQRLRFLGQRVELLARGAGAAGHDDAAHDAAAGHRVAEHAEGRVGEHGRHVGDGHADAEVGLVGPVLRDRVRVRHPRERQR